MNQTMPPGSRTDPPEPLCAKDRFETYEEAEGYLSEFTDYERMIKAAVAAEDLFDLGRIQTLLGRVGDPHRALEGIHLAGTKGKGSTAIFAEALLRAHGIETGLFTSPHLVVKEERIQVSGRMITRAEFLEWMNVLRPSLMALKDTAQPPTFFDIVTTIGFLHFRARGVGAAVLEVGLGGRLDSTNVFSPDVCVITRLGLDHTEKLGHTLAEIAAEKAGIIKAETPVVAQPQEPEAREVLEARCRRVGAPLFWVGDRIRIEEEGGSDPSGFEILTPLARYAGISLSALGRHQRTNAAAALAAVEIFLRKRKGLLPDPERVRRALLDTRPPGRIEVLARSPLFVVDGAHNPMAIEVLLKTVREELRFRDLHVVFACSRDKDYRGMLSLLATRADRWTLPAFDFPRIESPAIVREVLTEIAPASRIRLAADPGEALEDAYRRSGSEDCILCCGSFYLIGEVLKLMPRSP